MSILRQLFKRAIVFGLLVGSLTIGCWLSVSKMSSTKENANEMMILRETPEKRQSLNLTVDSVLLHDTFIRHCITGEIIGRKTSGEMTVAFHERSKVQSSSAETASIRQEAFTNVFKKTLWGTSKDEHFQGPIASGPGSTLHAAQEAIVTLTTLINEIKRQHNVSRVRLLDIPCGDMLWMSRFLSTRDDIDYTGIDIVADLITSHKKQFAAHTTWKFILSDVVLNGINGSFDIVFCRQMLQHLFSVDVMRVLGHFSSLGDRQPRRPVYLLTTTFSWISQNADLAQSSGTRYRWINLELPPMSLEPPLCLSQDGITKDPVHIFGLWRLPLRQVGRCSRVNAVTARGGGLVSTVYSCGQWER